jgi:hypothetical protein
MELEKLFLHLVHEVVRNTRSGIKTRSDRFVKPIGESGGRKIDAKTCWYRITTGGIQDPM